MMAVQMIKVGEETGELGKMLKHVAEFYQANVEAFMKRFGTLIEPFMLVFMAAMIGTIVIAIFLPLFKLGQGGHMHLKKYFLPIFDTLPGHGILNMKVAVIL